MKKCILLSFLLAFSTGCSGLIDDFLNEEREEEKTSPPSSALPPTQMDIRMIPGKVEASGGGTHSLRATIKYKDEDEISGGGTHSMRVEIGKRSK